MSNAIGGSVGVVAYMALFGGIGFIFVFINLLVGRLFRPSNPTSEKLEIYECGEPTIGSSFVQFDLRFYVVALIFIIFDVEVAFLFPWATVFGKAEELAHPTKATVVAMETGELQMTPATKAAYQEFGLRNPTLPAGGDAAKAAEEIQYGGQRLLWLATVEVLVFFVILLIAFAYEWKIGALDWVRAIVDEFKEQQLAANPPPSAATAEETQPILSA